ncbi:MAG: type 4a pilus biogenesis protein PilO [Patescibacteria group bacterium]
MIKNIIIIILILGFIALVVFLDVPGVQNILELRKSIASEKEKLLDKQELFAKVERLVQAYEENKESVEKIDHILPSGEKIPDLIVQLEALAFEQGLSLENIDIITIKEEESRVPQATLTEKPAVTYKTMSVSMKIVGSYEAFKAFLKSVEENLRLLDINSVEFTTESKEGGKVFGFEVRLITYHQ